MAASELYPDSELYMGFVSYLAYLNSYNHIDIRHVDINDIVWGQFGRTYWPAVVTDIYNDGILKVWFVHNPYKSVELRVTEAMSFQDFEEFGVQFRDQAIASDCVEIFHEIVEIALQYMSRKSEGREEDPLQFFLSTNSDILKKNYETKYEAQKHISSESEEDIEVPSNMKGMVLGAFQEDSKEGAKESTSPAMLTKENSYVKQLVSYIKYGSVKYYLVQLLKDETSSFYYELYKKCIEVFTTQKMEQICYGPVDDVETLTDIISYLVTGYRNILEVLPESVPVPECEPYFIAAVWLPEAISFAISCHNGIPVYDAYEELIQSSALRPDYLRYVEEYRVESAVPLIKVSEGLDVSSDDYCCGPSTAKPPLQFLDALEIVNDLVFVDQTDRNTYFTMLEEKMQKLKEERSKTRG